jgi:lipoyl(octanoyl) transferase
MLCTAAPQSIFNRIVAEINACVVVWCGCLPYSQALVLQTRICELKKRGFKRDVLLLLEHTPVITLGRSAKRENLLVDEDYLDKKGIDLRETDRGGDITFHGPGQLVGYPILALDTGERDVRDYMRRLEESLIRLLREFGIESTRNPGYTGVWTKHGKVAAMGVHISRWITRHGFALNVNTDLSFFNLIIACGITDRGVTSMQKLLAGKLDIETVAEKYIQEFGSVFKRHMIKMDTGVLLSELDRFEETKDPAQ